MKVPGFYFFQSNCWRKGQEELRTIHLPKWLPIIKIIHNPFTNLHILLGKFIRVHL